MAKALPNKTVRYWVEQIAIYEKAFQNWEGAAKKIVKRYKDERNESSAEVPKARFNILWSNVQTLSPALYAKSPIPNIDRRFEDDDVTGTTAARVLERATTYFVDNDLFDSVMSQSVLDRLLPGRGVAWVRYVPQFEEGAEITDDVVKGSEDVPELTTEDVVIDYVHWTDFLHGWGRTWEEVPWVGRKVYMSKAEMKKRGFKNWDKVPLEKDRDKEDGEEKQTIAKAVVYEIWNKTTKEACWIHKSMDEELDKRKDPLGLKDFFPCPKPIYATLANDNLIPTPDYKQYESQARELDDLTARITSIQGSLKVVGVYDASAEGLSRILAEGIDNKMVPVEQFALLAEKGGMKGVVDWFPMEMVANVLVAMYEARDKVKQDLYEITGISDIVRGATDPNETLGAQELKGKFATLRMDNNQKDVARFSRDLVRMIAEIIAEHFDIDTIKEIAGIKLLSEQEKQQIIMQSKMPGPPGPDGQPTPPPPLPDDMQELLALPTWEEVEALLRNDTLRSFRISIETDSTIKQDQEAEKAARVELIGSVTQFLAMAAELPAPLQPLAGELLQFGVKGFKISRELETAFDVMLKKINKQAQAPPPPDPEMMKAQADMQNDEQQRQLEREKMGQEKYLADQNFALENKKMAVEEQRMGNEKLAMRLDAKTKVQPEVALSDPDMNDAPVTPLVQMIQDNMGQIAQMIMQGLQQIAAQQQAADQAILAAVTAPKKTDVIRGADGRITGGVSRVETIN